MTAQELISHFNRVYGIEKEWPKTYEVDAVTYANCCQFLFDEASDHVVFEYENFVSKQISLGKVNRGLMFKNVELILKS